MNIEFTTTKSEGMERHLRVTVPTDEVRQVANRTALKYGSRLTVPGFRPGKAPAAMIRKRYADVILSEAIEELVNNACQEVLRRENVELVSEPHVHDLDFGEGKPLTFELHIAVKPEIRLARVQGLRVRRPVADVTEQQVGERIRQMAERRAHIAPVEGTPESGDTITIVLASGDEGKRLPPGREFTITLGMGHVVAPIEELIMATPVGKTVQKTVRWPEDFPDESQRGKAKTVRVFVVEGKRKVYPALDDAFAREVGDYDNLDELRAKVTEDLRQSAEQAIELEVRQRLMDEILAANPFEVPRIWVERALQAHAESNQVPAAELDRFAIENWARVESSVRREMAIDAIARAEKLTPTEAEIDEHVSELATKRLRSAGALYAEMQENGELRKLERHYREKKVFDWLLERNTVE